MKYYCALAHERFQPDELLKQAAAAELAGFDGVCCSDHLAPWWTEQTAPTASGNAWVWLGGAARETKKVDIGSAVTAIVHRYNPVVVAQQIATLELIAPGRTFLGVGSGEAMNEEKAARKEPFVLLQAVFSYAANDDKALESSREWKGTMVDRHYMNVSAADPEGALRLYGDKVLPKLKSG